MKKSLSNEWALLFDISIIIEPSSYDILYLWVKGKFSDVNVYRNLKCGKMYIHTQSLRLLFYYLRFVAFSFYKVITNYSTYIIAMKHFPISSSYRLSCSCTYLIRMLYLCYCFVLLVCIRITLS